MSVFSELSSTQPQDSPDQEDIPELVSATDDSDQEDIPELVSVTDDSEPENVSEPESVTESELELLRELGNPVTKHIMHSNDVELRFFNCI